MDAFDVGPVLRAIRLHLGMTQRAAAERAGVSQSVYSRAERGKLAGLTFGSLHRIAVGLGATVSVDIDYKGGFADRLVDAGHATLAEFVVGFVRRYGWQVELEFSFNVFGDRGSVDVLAWHATTRTLLIVEVKSRFLDLQAMLISMSRKVRVVPGAVRDELGWDASSVGRLIVAYGTAENRSIIDRHALAARTGRRARGRVARIRRRGAVPGASTTMTSLGAAVQAAASRALDAALPASCVGCGSEGPPVCRRCEPALDARLGSPGGVAIGLPGDLPEPLLQLEWCAPFHGVTRAALHAIKYGGEQRLADPLGAAVARRWAAVGVGADLLTNVPVHADRARQRGYDQAELIARRAATDLRLPFASLLVRARATVAQFDLDRRDRAHNVRDAFVADPRNAAAVPGRWVLLIDDVVTTGATLAACAGALLDVGALGVSAITVARER